MLHDLLDDGERHNPLIPAVLGVLSLIRPLRRSLARSFDEAGAAKRPAESLSSTGAARSLRECLLGLLALELRLTRELAATVPESPAKTARPRPTQLLR